jgi:hypothetical protein
MKTYQVKFSCYYIIEAEAQEDAETKAQELYAVDAEPDRETMQTEEVEDEND